MKIQLFLVGMFMPLLGTTASSSSMETDTGKHGYTIAKEFVQNHPERFEMIKGDPTKTMAISVVRVGDKKVSYVGEVYLKKGKLAINKIKTKK